MLHVVERVADQVFIPFTVGGGIRTVEDVRRMLRAGADKVSLNTAAVNDVELVQRAADEFGNQCIVVAIDARRRNAEDPGAGWEVVTHGGRTPTGLGAVEWAVHACDLGAGELLLTSMDRDGTKVGYDIELLRAVGDAVDVPADRQRRRRHPRAPLRRRHRGRGHRAARGLHLPLRPVHGAGGQGRPHGPWGDGPSGLNCR